MSMDSRSTLDFQDHEKWLTWHSVKSFVDSGFSLLSQSMVGQEADRVYGGLVPLVPLAILLP